MSSDDTRYRNRYSQNETGGNILLHPESIDKPSPYRAAVETFQITVRGETFDAPEPVRTPLKNGAHYWLADPTANEFFRAYYWDGGEMDKRHLVRGLIHLNEAAAVIHARAMCGVK